MKCKWLGASYPHDFIPTETSPFRCVEIPAYSDFLRRSFFRLIFFPCWRTRINRDSAHANSRAKTTRPSTTRGKVNGPGKMIKSSPITIRVEPTKKTIVFLSDWGSNFHVFEKLFFILSHHRRMKNISKLNDPSVITRQSVTPNYATL